jgi:hypothetical protein
MLYTKIYIPGYKTGSRPNLKKPPFSPATTQKSTVPLSNQIPYKSNRNPKYISRPTFLYKEK